MKKKVNVMSNGQSHSSFAPWELALAPSAWYLATIATTSSLLSLTTTTSLLTLATVASTTPSWYLKTGAPNVSTLDDWFRDEEEKI